LNVNLDILLMKTMKFIFLLLAVNLYFVGCKEAVDNQKDETQQTGKSTLFAKKVNAKAFKNIIATDSVLIIDVRTPDNFIDGHIPGAINLDWTNQERFNEKIKTLAKDQTVLLYCNSGHRSTLATQYLKEQGFEKLYNLETGIEGWKAENYEVEK